MKRAMRRQVRGVNMVLANFARVMNSVDGSAERAIAHWSFDVMDRALELVPVDTGELFRSNYVEKPRQTKQGPQGRFGFRADHAIPVHEATTQQFRNGQSQFLAQAIDENKEKFLPTLALYGRRGLKKTLSANVFMK